MIGLNDHVGFSLNKAQLKTTQPLTHYNVIDMFFRHAEASSYYLEDDPEYDDEIDEEFEKFLLEKEAQLQ